MIVVIIQARMGSSRLPNKVMREVLGKPLIDYLLERVSVAEKVDKIVLATTTKPEDDSLAKHVTSLGYDVFRGSEDDVLSRYYYAFYEFKGELEESSAIVRITGDCPLIDSYLIDEVIKVYQTKGMDYVALSPDFSEGLDVEIFSIPELREIFLKVSNADKGIIIIEPVKTAILILFLLLRRSFSKMGRTPILFSSRLFSLWLIKNSFRI